MKKILLIMLLSITFPIFSSAQNIYVAGQIDGDWGPSHQMSNYHLGDFDYYYVTILATGNYTNALFNFQADGTYNKWNDVTANVNTVNTYIWHDNNGGINNVIDSDVTSGNYYTFRLKDNEYANAKGIVMETSASPVTINSVSQSPTSDLVSNNDAITVTVTASASPSAEEIVYVRYSTTSNFSSSTLVPVSFSGTSGTATIPAQAAETIIYYYVFTTTVSSPSSDYDLLTINYDNNSGSNYSYTVKHGTAASTNWNVGSTWTSGSVPATDDDVIIEHEVIVASDVECNDLTIEVGAKLTVNENYSHTIHGYVWVWGDVWISPSSSFTVTRDLWVWSIGEVIILPKGNLQINGSTTNSGSILLKSDSEGTASFIPVGNYSGDDNVTAQRYISQDKWHYISTPVNDSRVFNTTGFLDLTSGKAANDQFYYWDEDGTDNGSTGIWFDILNGLSGVTYSTGSFNTAQGYAITKKVANKTISFVGEPITANKTIPITYDASSTNPGANLVGNPFSSDIALNDNADGVNNFLKQNFENLHYIYNAVYLWNEGDSWSGGDDYLPINNASASTFSPAGQAFMVVANDANFDLQFNTNIRKHGTAPFYKNTNTDNTKRLELFVKDSENRGNRTTIAFMENMTLGLDPSYDAGKLKGNPNIALYTRLVEDNGVDFAIQALPNDNIESLTVPVGIDVIEATTCTFSVKPDALEGYPIYLQDIKESTVTNLKENSYSTLVTESGAGRFFLHFTDISSITNPQLSEQLNIFSSNSNIEIRSNKPIDAIINIYNIAGQLITTSQLNNESSASVNITNYKGIAIVSVTTSGQTLNEKVIVW